MREREILFGVLLKVDCRENLGTGDILDIELVPPVLDR